VAGATISLLDGSTVDPAKFPSGWRIQIAGAGPGVPSGERYVVRLQLPHVVHVDGFETGGLHAWSDAAPSPIRGDRGKRRGRATDRFCQSRFVTEARVRRSIRGS
jgi:hypothetical protein